MTAVRAWSPYRPREWLALALTAIGYAVVIHFAITKFSVDGVVSVVFPTPGVSLALLTLAGLRWWPAVYAGEVLGKLSTGTALGPALALSAVDTLEPLVGAWLLRRSADFDPSLGRLRDFVRLLVVALAVSGPAAVAGTAILTQVGVPAPSGNSYWADVALWWRGELTGMLLLTPLILVWHRPPSGWLWRSRATELALCFGLAFVVGAVLYLGAGPVWIHPVETDYLPFLFVAWAAVRFGRHGVLVMVLMTALQALAGALAGVGLYAQDMAAGRLLNFWLFMSVLALVGLLLALAVRERETALGTMESVQARLRFLLSATPVVIYTARAEGDYAATWISENVERLCGWSAAEFLADPGLWLRHVHPDDAPRLMAELGALFVDGVHQQEYRFRCKDGSWRWMRDQLALVRGPDGRPLELVGCWFDVSERRAAEDRIRAALHEKEVLLKEVYHRVKNNLQVVSSLLNLQSRRAADGVANALLQQSANRVSSMAFVHEQLYRSGDLSSIAFSDYAVQLVTHLRDTQGEVAQRVPVELDLDDVRLGIETAIPLGLVINELVSNAYEHAFRDGRVGLISLWLRKGEAGGLELGVSDDGVGLPPGFSLETSASLGLQLVLSLTEQLGGALDYGTAKPHGTRFTLRVRTGVAPDTLEASAAAPAPTPDQAVT